MEVAVDRGRIIGTADIIDCHGHFAVREFFLIKKERNDTGVEVIEGRKKKRKKEAMEEKSETGDDGFAGTCIRTSTRKIIRRRDGYNNYFKTKSNHFTIINLVHLHIVLLKMKKKIGAMNERFHRGTVGYVENIECSSFLFRKKEEMFLCD